MANANSTKRALTGVPDTLTGDPVPLPNLPEEMIIGILQRLPVKALLKFRCVAKSWLSIISSAQFIKAHLKISTKNNVGCHNRLVFGSSHRPSVFYTFSLDAKKDENSCVDTLVFDYPINDLYDAIQIVGSCNGLVCVAMGSCSVVLLNPATRKSKKLPISGRNMFSIEYGFGYDALNDDHKVVEFSWINPDQGLYETQVKVYSSKADSWRVMDWADWPGCKIFDGPGVFVEGAIHWKVYYDDDPSNWGIIAQNVTTETCSILDLPTIVSDDAKVMLGVVGGCLCASYDYRSYMDVWVMKEYGVKESWTKLVCFPYLFCMKHHDNVRPKLLFVSENGGVFLNLGSDLIMYKQSQYHEVYRLSNDIEVEAASYSESLVSPDFDHF